MTDATPIARRDAELSRICRAIELRPDATHVRECSHAKQARDASVGFPVAGALGVRVELEKLFGSQIDRRSDGPRLGPSGLPAPLAAQRIDGPRSRT